VQGVKDEKKNRVGGVKGFGAKLLLDLWLGLRSKSPKRYGRKGRALGLLLKWVW